MLLRAKEIAYVTGYSETQSRRFIKRIKEKNHSEYKEAAVCITHLCREFNMDEEQVYKRLKVRK